LHPTLPLKPEKHQKFQQLAGFSFNNFYKQVSSPASTATSDELQFRQVTITMHAFHRHGFQYPMRAFDRRDFHNPMCVLSIGTTSKIRCRFQPRRGNNHKRLRACGVRRVDGGSRGHDGCDGYEHLQQCYDCEASYNEPGPIT
jgi:hypothetical protein